MKLLAVADVREFFRESLQTALEHQHLRVRDHTEHYVVNLLAMFARTDALFEPGQEPRSQLKPLALLLAEAVDAPDDRQRFRMYGREQLAVLLGVAGEAGLRVAGLVGAGLAAAALEPAPESLLQLELATHPPHLCRMVATPEAAA